MLARTFQGIRDWLKRLNQAREARFAFERLVIVQSNEDGATVTFPKRVMQSIAWNEVVRVAIETNDSGPWGSDFWWFLEGAEKRSRIPPRRHGRNRAFRSVCRTIPRL